MGDYKSTTMNSVSGDGQPQQQSAGRHFDRKCVFEPTTPVELPDECEVEFEPAIVQTPANEPPLNDVYAILSERYRSGEHDIAERHNEYQP